MKTIRSGSLCLILLFAGGLLAQQQPPTTPPATPPAGSPPDQQQPPEAQSPRSNIQQPPPPLPKVVDVRQPGEAGLFLGVFGWFPTQEPVMDKGHGATFTDFSKTTLQGKPNYSKGVELGLAVGLHNMIHLSYFDSRASGNFTNATDLRLWNQTYTAGTYLSTNYRVQSAKISFDYLTWPYPVETRRFRLKTLWQVEYTSIRTGFDAPLLPLFDSLGNPIVDASGNPVDYSGTGSHWFILPTFGLQTQYWTTKNFRLEASASGFDIPHHAATWDADATANLRFGHLELRAGAKAFHFKMSPAAEFFMHGTMASGFVGLRWYSK